MDYVDKNLVKNEKVILRGKIHWTVLLTALLIIGLVELLLAGAKFAIIEVLGATGAMGDPAFFEEEILSSVWLIPAWAFRIGIWCRFVFPLFGSFSTKFAVTNRRVVGKVGIFSVKAIDFPIDKIDNVVYSAGFFGKIFKYYTLIVTGTSGDKYHLKGIQNAPQLKNTIMEVIDENQELVRRQQMGRVMQVAPIMEQRR